jgi:hypothetical protein
MLSKPFLPALLALCLLILVPPFEAAAAAPTSSPMPPIASGHPRLGFHPDTGQAEAARLTKSPLWKAFLQRTKRALSVPNPKAATLATIISHGGLVELATDDAALGKMVGEAIEQFSQPVLAGAWNQQNDLVHNEQITALAFGYDWAYAYLTPKQRDLAAQALLALCAYGRKEFWFYFKPGSYSGFNNHTHFNHLGFAVAGLALAGDHPEGRKLAEEGYAAWTGFLLPIFDKFVGSNGIWNEGTHYNMVAYRPTFIWMTAASTALKKDFFQAPWVRQAGLSYLYLTRADNSMTILGDWWTDTSDDTVGNLLSRSFPVVARAAAAARDGHLQSFAQREMPYVETHDLDVWSLLWYDPAVPTRPITELPASHLFQGDASVGGGETLAVLRSGWGPNDRMITLSMGDWLGHHDHYDSNAFTIHYKGDLANDPGYGGEKDIDWTYYRRTSAHSSLLVPVPEAQAVKDDPQLKERGWGYDGGQRVPLAQDRPRDLAQFFAVRNPEYPNKSLFETGDCLKFVTKPTYDYVVGDATRAYHKSQITRWVRHLVYLKPDIVILYDVVETPPARAPRWLLKTVTKPARAGSEYIVRNGGGELGFRTLLPASPETNIVETPPTSTYSKGLGNGQEYRTEVVSPAGTEHRFLHVLQIRDTGATALRECRWKRDGDRLRVWVNNTEVLLRWDGTPEAVVR